MSYGRMLERFLLSRSLRATGVIIDYMSRKVKRFLQVFSNFFGILVFNDVRPVFQQIIQIDPVIFVAELAVHLRDGVLIAHFFDLFFAKAADHFFNALETAVALIGHMVAVQNIRLEALQRQLQHIAHAHALLQHRCHAGHGLDVLFKMLDFLLGGTGQQLHDKAACTADTQVLIHQHTKSADRGDLLADGKVGGYILGDLAGGQRHLADIRLAHAEVADNIKGAVLADSSAYIQMAVCPRGQLYDRMLHIALDIACTVRNRQQTARRAAALDLQRHRVLRAFQHDAHHRSSRQQAAQRRRGDSARLVQALHIADDLGRVHAVKYNAAVLGNAAQHVMILFHCFHPLVCIA